MICTHELCQVIQAYEVTRAENPSHRDPIWQVTLRSSVNGVIHKELYVPLTFNLLPKQIHTQYTYHMKDPTEVCHLVVVVGLMHR